MAVCPRRAAAPIGRRGASPAGGGIGPPARNAGGHSPPAWLPSREIGQPQKVCGGGAASQGRALYPRPAPGGAGCVPGPRTFCAGARGLGLSARGPPPVLGRRQPPRQSAAAASLGPAQRPRRVAAPLAVPLVLGSPGPGVERARPPRSGFRVAGRPPVRFSLRASVRGPPVGPPQRKGRRRKAAPFMRRLRAPGAPLVLRPPFRRACRGRAPRGARPG